MTVVVMWHTRFTHAAFRKAANAAANNGRERKDLYTGICVVLLLKCCTSVGGLSVCELYN